MKWLLIIVGIVVAIPVLIALVGLTLPRDHVASRSAVVAQPPDAVFARIRDVANASSWRKDVQRVELLGVVDGRFRFREHGGHGAVTYEIVEEQPPRRMVTRIVDENLGYSGSWTYELEPLPEGTRVTITERGEVSNVIFRTLSKFVFGHHATIEKYLNALSGVRA